MRHWFSAFLAVVAVTMIVAGSRGVGFAFRDNPRGPALTLGTGVAILPFALWQYAIERRSRPK
ncbi:MAG TPA: hypothetical protein VEA69_05560 [Tepidisphaeraceae bacterium]|nr:hypothetical protein [Tepidisphaeraceae bacterium]